jgi:hypothetical protein
MNVVGQLVPLLVVAAICALIVASLMRNRLPRFTMPVAPKRPRRTTPLRMVKSDRMDRDLADLLRGEEKRPD